MHTLSQEQSLTIPVVNVQTFQPSNFQPEWNLELETHLTTLKLIKRSRSLASQHIRVFAAWHTAVFGGFDPRALTQYALLTYRHHSLEGARVTAATWNSRHWALTILCNFIERPQLMVGIEQKDGQPSEIHRTLTDAEYHRLHQVLEQRIQRAITPFEYRDRVRDRAAVVLMLECGLRVDEAAQLDKTDIEINERSGWVRVRNGKGGKERRVPVNMLARSTAWEWMKCRADENLALFDGKQTKRLSSRSIQRIVTDLRAETRIPDLLCHSLRFTFAKRTEQRMIAQGKGPTEIIRTIQRLLGHKRADTTEIYLRSSADELLSAVEGVM